MFPPNHPHAPKVCAPTAGAFDADRRRAATQWQPAASTIAADAGPLTVDLPTPRIANHFVAVAISALGVATVNAPAPSPLSGLYLIKENSPIESLAVASVGDGLLLGARGLQLPCDWFVMPVAGGAKFAYSCVARLSAPLIVPNGYVIRFLLNIVPATAAPGPGLNSTALLTAQGSIEPD